MREEDDISGEQAELCGVKTQSDCFLSHLHSVEIIGIAMLSDLKFIRCILSNAPVLETMKIYTNRHVEAEKVLTILEELFRSQQASTWAEIIYLGHYKASQWEHKVNFLSLFSFFSLLFCCLKEEYEHKSTFFCVLSSNHHHHFILSLSHRSRWA